MEPIPGINVLSPWKPGILALAVFTLMAMGLVIALLFISSWLGEMHAVFRDCAMYLEPSSRLVLPKEEVEVRPVVHHFRRPADHDRVAGVFFEPPAVP